MSSPKPFRQSGFTLIELLVVIAIISLLVSILLPSLNRAKDLAKITVCQSNLRNVGLAVNTYLNENNGNFPDSTPFGYGGDDPGVGGPLPGHTRCMPFFLIPQLPPVEGLLWNGTTGKRANPSYNCPNKVTDAPDGDLAEGYAHGTYLWNMSQVDTDGEKANLDDINVDDLKEAQSGIGLSRDFVALEWNIGGVSSLRYGPAHGDVVNILFLDGHCESSTDPGYQYYNRANVDTGGGTPFPWPGASPEL
jgi:prepilin-type N-terminal cleavage/methylation domain-containing protein/prepilin-type processing-associated H-X9-DG protein